MERAVNIGREWKIDMRVRERGEVKKAMLGAERLSRNWIKFERQTEKGRNERRKLEAAPSPSMLSIRPFKINHSAPLLVTNTLLDSI